MSLDLNWIKVGFHTTTDDKDDDTIVVASVARVTNGARGPNLAGLTSNWGGHLNDNTDSAAFNLGLGVYGQWALGNEYVLTVTINPNGHDTWRFDCYLYLQFQSLPLRTYTFMNHALSQNVRSNDYYFTL